jgi:hypothetical protein
LDFPGKWGEIESNQALHGLAIVIHSSCQEWVTGLQGFCNTIPQDRAMFFNAEVDCQLTTASAMHSLSVDERRSEDPSRQTP